MTPEQVERLAAFLKGSDALRFVYCWDFDGKRPVVRWRKPPKIVEGTFFYDGRFKRTPWILSYFKQGKTRRVDLVFPSFETALAHMRMAG